MCHETSVPGEVYVSCATSDSHFMALWEGQCEKTFPNPNFDNYE